MAANNDIPAFSVRDHMLHAENVAVNTLAARYGTPLYVYSAGRIRANIARLRAALGTDILMAYAVKANTNGAILSLMAESGLGADVVSHGEMLRALAAGIPAERIVFSGVGKTDGELAFAAVQGVAQINIESAGELERLCALPLKRPVRVAFRLNPDVDAKTHAKISTGLRKNKFGIPAGEILGLYKGVLNHPFVRPVGLGVHIGSQITETAPFVKGFQALAALAQELPVETLDFGGGLGIVYTDEKPAAVQAYAAAVQNILAPLGKKLITEPGRYLVGDAGVLLARVIDVKDSPTRPLAILDAGMNDLMRPALYDAVHVLRPGTEKAGIPEAFDVAGPVCESSDMFLTNWPMVRPARGDVMALMNAGAYGMAMAGTYNSRPLPAEILVDGDKHALIRQRQNYAALTSEEQEPEWVA